MSVLDSAHRSSVKPFSGRKRVDRRILRFSILIGLMGALLVGLAYMVAACPLLLRWRVANLRALSEISCTGASCDTATYSTDWQSDQPDYIIDTQTRFSIDVATPTETMRGHFAPLDYSDAAFFAKFREPTSYITPDGEVWRLYSRAVQADLAKTFEVIVGYTMKAPSKAIVTPNSLIGDVDAALRREADKLAMGLSEDKAAIRLPRNGFSADGFQIVDRGTNRVLVQGPSIPAFFPKDVSFPAPGLSFYIGEGSVYVAETDLNGRLLATSIIEIGGFWWMLSSCAIGLFCTSIIAQALSRRFLKNYFAIRGMQVPNLVEALRAGEGQSVEFKGGLSDDESKKGSVDDELLKSVAAFANTNDGVIFVGVDDAGRVRGLSLDFAQKDRLALKIDQLIRIRIRPTPPVQIVFEDARGFLIAKVLVARGDGRLYMMGGTIYIRRGSSDIQAQPEDVERLVSMYAF